MDYQAYKSVTWYQTENYDKHIMKNDEGSQKG